MAALISRHEDGEINAAILRRMGVEPIRGSGGTGAEKIRLHGGGATALRAMAKQPATMGRTMVHDGRCARKCRAVPASALLPWRG